ncbi:MAG: rhamnogalacturonan acetylesterase [Eubacteriales bacterium]|nr:rhamnogalacturonan acetylesterase [Eubacteriales bacterium]
MEILFHKMDGVQEDTEFLRIPELSNGFTGNGEAAAPDMPSGMLPVSLYSGQVAFGVYGISLVLEAREDIERLYLFTGRRQLREVVSLKRGERLVRVFYQSAAEIIPRYEETVYPVSHLSVTFCTLHPEAVRVCCCKAEPAPGAARIFLCGDSTVTDHSSEQPYNPGACYGAWGQALTAYLNGPVAVENQAHCGLTTENFEKEGHLELVKRHIRKGDLCLFQFAHNDQKLPHLMAETGYADYLRRFIREIRSLGGQPVLVTPLGRNIWNEDGTYLDLLEDYARAVRQIGSETDTSVIDLHGYSVDRIRRQGMERSCDYFHPDDYTHNNEYGACLFAGYIAGELGRQLAGWDTRTKPGPDFEPPHHVWDGLKGNGYQEQAAGQKEQFDRMEKSTGALLEVIREARKKAGHLKQDL